MATKKRAKPTPEETPEEVRVRVLRRLPHSMVAPGEHYGPDVEQGAVVTLPEATASGLIAKGHVEEA
ncbi:MAG: hypothetical protein AAF845_05725 [Bacteroidota bacterium]